MNKFIVEIEHNGLFLLHEKVVYVGGTVDFFDNCNDDTWLILSIEDFF
jgi:hypothetical protein